jgi:adenylyltransferase/sulfurtransferase
MNRYIRHIQLDGFGEASQNKLAKTSVLVIGAGGLGCPVLSQLAAMGVLNIGIVDNDVVDISNLHRQLLYDESDVGKLKVNVAKTKLEKMNSELNCKIFPTYLSKNNAVEILTDYDIIVDGTDNFHSRYLINDSCVILKKPLIYGAVHQFEGQVSVFNVENNGTISANYRDLFSIPPLPNQVPSCNEAGVLGNLPNLIGTFMSIEVIKLMTGLGSPLTNKILTYDIRNHSSYILEFNQSSAEGDNPKTITELNNYNYQEFCNQNSDHMEAEVLFNLIEENPKAVLVDIRSAFEEPQLNHLKYIRVPLFDLPNNIELLEKYECIIFVCQRGIRSAQAIQWAKKQWPNKSIFHFERGASALLKAYYDN